MIHTPKNIYVDLTDTCSSYLFSAVFENQNKIPLECSTQVYNSLEFNSSAVPISVINTTKIKSESASLVNLNSESDQDNLTFTNPLAEEEPEEDLKAAVDLEVTGSLIPGTTPEAEVVPLVVDPDLEIKVRRACERISENVHICANEPSLAFFRLSEHVRKALPPTVESRQQVQTIQRQLGAAYEDADIALQ